MIAYAVDAAARREYDGAQAWLAIARELRQGSVAPEQPADRLTLHDVEGIVCGHGRVVVRRRGSVSRSEWWRHADGDATVCDDVQQETEHDRRHRANITWTTVAPPATYGDAPTAVAERAYAADGERVQHFAESGKTWLDASLELPDKLVGSQSPETTPSDLENTAVLSTRVRVSPARPAAVAPPTHGVCVNDGLDIHLIASASGEAPRYAHDVSGQSVCPEQRSPEGHETFVHRFAWPAPQG